ncbi:MAG: hypothetical protein NW226_01585 [Microscillaceae bacterium]|nr:hypothetical protein [Microscillaceae bacterium]
MQVRGNLPLVKPEIWANPKMNNKIALSNSLKIQMADEGTGGGEDPDEGVKPVEPRPEEETEKN